MSKIPKKNSKLSASRIEEKEQVLDDITAKYAYEILKKLADEDAKLKELLKVLENAEERRKRAGQPSYDVSKLCETLGV